MTEINLFKSSPDAYELAVGTFAIQVMAVMAERLRHANEARTPN
jgi:hypothetical protein